MCVLVASEVRTGQCPTLLQFGNNERIRASRVSTVVESCSGRSAKKIELNLHLRPAGSIERTKYFSHEKTS